MFPEITDDWAEEAAEWLTRDRAHGFPMAPHELYIALSLLVDPEATDEERMLGAEDLMNHVAHAYSDGNTRKQRRRWDRALSLNLSLASHFMSAPREAAVLEIAHAYYGASYSTKPEFPLAEIYVRARILWERAGGKEYNEDVSPRWIA